MSSSMSQCLIAEDLRCGLRAGACSRCSSCTSSCSPRLIASEVIRVIGIDCRRNRCVLPPTCSFDRPFFFGSQSCMWRERESEREREREERESQREREGPRLSILTAGTKAAQAEAPTAFSSRSRTFRKKTKSRKSRTDKVDIEVI